MADVESRKSPIPVQDRSGINSGSARSTPEKNGINSPPPSIPTSSAALLNLISNLPAGPSLQGLLQPQLLAAFATMAAMSNNPNPAVSMGGFPGAFPGLSPGGSDPSTTLQTLAQLQTLFNPAAQMMSMQQVIYNYIF